MAVLAVSAQASQQHPAWRRTVGGPLVTTSPLEILLYATAAGGSAVGLTGQATARKVVAAGGLSALGLTAHRTGTPTIAESGSPGLGLAADVVPRKVAVVAGRSTLGLAAAAKPPTLPPIHSGSPVYPLAWVAGPPT